MFSQASLCKVADFPFSSSCFLLDYAPADKVGKIRLFNLGAEMKEEQTLNDW